MAIEQFGIGRAVKLLQEGQRVTRAGWNGPDQFLTLQEPDSMSSMTMPYVYISRTRGVSTQFKVPWVCSQADLLAVDWQVW